MAIVEAAQKIPATVGAISKLQSNEYGDYRSVLFEGAGLEGGKLWRKMPPEQADRFQRGDQVNLIPTSKKGKPGWDIERLNGAAPTAPPQSQAVPPTADVAQVSQAQAIAEYMDKMAGLYAAAYRRAAAAMDGAPDDAIQVAASSVFIATKDKFMLTRS